MFISVTRIRLKSLRFFRPFFRHNAAIFRQIQSTPGVLSNSARIQNPWAYWTLTTWESKEAMMRFRGSGAHLQAMKDMRRFTSEATSAHWESDRMPTWAEAKEQLIKNPASQYKF